jgi:type III secretion protein R
LRSAIGAPQLPPTEVLTGLALVLTLEVMAPTGERMLAAVSPVFPTLSGARAPDLTSAETAAAPGTAAARAKEPLREFLLKHTGARDRATFHGSRST